jgi:diguanylate cyclase (GGDEF)-like protein/PAS domain S-box-containing protein
MSNDEGKRQIQSQLKSVIGYSLLDIGHSNKKWNGSESDMKKPVKNTKSMTPQATALRRRAEEMARKTKALSPENPEALSSEEVRQTLQELRVYQIELEMQNDELRHTQVELDNSLIRYFDLYDLAPVGYVTVSKQGLILEANLSAATMLGVARGTLVKRMLTQFIFKEDQDIYYLHHKKLFNTGKTQTCELRMVNKIGTQFWAHMVAAAGNDKDGATTIRIVMSDITDRKQAEKKLRNSEEKFRMLAESSSFAIMMHQGDRWIYANRAAEEISGYTEKELCGMHFWDIVHPDYRDMVKQSGFNRQQGKVLPRAYEFKIIAKNGLEKWVILTGSPIQYEDKATALISVTDITERKITEAALMESEIKYRRIFESFEDLYYQTDEKGIIRVLSPSLYRLTGWSPDELIGKPVTDVYVSPKDRKKLLAEISRSGFLRDYEVFLKKKDGTQTYASLTASILTDSDGRPCGTSGTLRDITERKRLESQREVMLEALRDSEKRYLELSIIDDLTQLYNSRHFHAQLEREIERSNRYGQPLTLLLLDIDKFKDFNDTYGHVQGDYVLSRLGHAIKRSLREIDSAYRYGGEEFTIILPMTMSEEGIVTAKRIQKELRKENFSPVLGQEVYITVSIGLAQYKPKEEIKAFVHRVDQFMYKVKKNERGKICSDDGNIR